MPNEKFTCPRCFKRCGNAGALKTHMKTHKKPETKSGSLMKWIGKREPVTSESKQKPKEAIELELIRKIQQLKLRKPIIREPTIVTNTLRPRPLRAPQRSQLSSLRLILALLLLLNDWPIPALTSDHHNFESLTFSTSIHWNQISLLWTKQCIIDS